MKLLAVLFSLVAPGAGNIFAGDYAQGAVLGLLFVLGRSGLLPLALRAFKVQTFKGVLQAFYTCNCFYITLIFYAIVSSFLQTKSNAPVHFLYAIIFAICISVAYKKAFSKFIFTAICGREGVYEFYLKNKKLPSEKK